MVDTTILPGISKTSKPADVLGALRQQGIVDLDGLVKKALDVGRTAADEVILPQDQSYFIHDHFILYHET
jgi:hypothetical protein